MDHETAVRMHAIERYILGDFSVAERDEFEEHMSDCPRCMEDLAVTDVFAANARAVFEDRTTGRDLTPQNRWLGLLRWSPVPAFAFSAALNLLLLGVCGYGLLRFVPTLESRLNQSQTLLQASESRVHQSEAQLHESSVPGVSQEFRVRGISRGAGVLQVSKSLPYLSLRFDLPQHYAHYSYSIAGPGVPLQGPVAVTRTDSLELIVPTAQLEPGDYLVQITGSDGGAPVPIAGCTLRVESNR
jgi:hypothetical protein